jgi:hypothetical protein
MSRPKGSFKRGKKALIHKGMRLKSYSDMPSSEGGAVSGFADQYGRVMVEFVNSKGELDIKPAGQCIASRH